MKKLESISAFFPAYNDAATISSMVISTLLTLPKVTDDYELIVVNDGSPDHTGEMLKELARVTPGSDSSPMRRTRVTEEALRSGFAASTKTWGLCAGRGCAVRSSRTAEIGRGRRRGVGRGQRVQNRPFRPLASNPDRKALPHDRPAPVRGSLRDVDCDYRLMRRKFSTRWISPPPPAPSVSKW